MYSNIIRHLILIFLSMALLMTASPYMGASQYEHADAAAESKQAHEQEPPSKPAAFPAADTVSRKANKIEAERASKPEAEPASNPAAESGSNADAPSVSSYISSAYYLNVREAANGKSKILRVIGKGTKLAVITVTDNGWLQLQGEGYVNGEYAVPVDNLPNTAAAAAEITFHGTSEPAKPSSQVKSESGLTDEHIKEIFKETDLAGHDLEAAILEIEDKYGINAYFTIAVMKLESGNGSSQLAKKKNNLFGLNACGGNAFKRATRFETKADSVRKFGELIFANYVGKGFTTVEKVARKYCPANNLWSSLVKAIMKRDHNLL